MRRFSFSTILLFLLSYTISSQTNTLRLTSDQLETLFLKQNLQLIAEKMNISLTDAEIAQAKLWDNPSLSISGVNLWSTSKQRDGETEAIPPLFGTFGRNTQFSVELSQLIQTANKRGKLVAREKISKEIAMSEFETVLKGLKTELHKSIAEIIYLQSYRNVLETQQNSFSKLIDSYKKQVAQGNIAKAELLRLQSSAFELDNEHNELLIELNGKWKELKTLLSIDPLSEIEIIDEASDLPDPFSVALPELLQKTEIHRSDIKKGQQQIRYSEKALAYEKSLRIPDITFSASYDRYGGVWKDFIGFGISVDLPLLNRNQGGIQSARIALSQSEVLKEQKLNLARHEVAEAYNNYLNAYRFYQKINANELLTELDKMLEVYSKNLLSRNINMLEYIDFMDAFRSNKQTFVDAQKKAKLQFEELKYVAGSTLTVEN